MKEENKEWKEDKKYSRKETKGRTKEHMNYKRQGKTAMRERIGKNK